MGEGKPKLLSLFELSCIVTLEVGHLEMGAQFSIMIRKNADGTKRTLMDRIRKQKKGSRLIF